MSYRNLLRLLLATGALMTALAWLASMKTMFTFAFNPAEEHRFSLHISPATMMLSLDSYPGNLFQFRTEEMTPEIMDSWVKSHGHFGRFHVEKVILSNLRGNWNTYWLALPLWATYLIYAGSALIAIRFLERRLDRMTTTSTAGE
ncbi:MAG: hypothetical protein EOP85_22460 [Verrucomicrobiaceae bacterium]|nr:MAG: hypothetical protein EOP85_22460 [Verrucomicrobiaceae bacterium]